MSQMTMELRCRLMLWRSKLLDAMRALLLTPGIHKKFEMANDRGLPGSIIGSRGALCGEGTCGRSMKSPCTRHPENCPDSEAMRDFAWGATRSFKPLHGICDFDLMFDAHIRDGHLYKAEPFLDTFHPFVLAHADSPCATASNSELAVTSAVY